MSYLSCLYIFMACMGFCIVFDIRSPKHMVFASLGGSLGWLVYLLSSGLNSDLLQFFIASCVICPIQECMARVFKAPVTGFLILSILPLVPGNGIYYTMEYCISGQVDQFISTGCILLASPAPLAMGVLFVSVACGFPHHPSFPAENSVIPVPHEVKKTPGSGRSVSGGFGERFIV